MTFRNGRYTYEIRRGGASSVYTVGDGVSTISEPVLFCFGEGAAGQTYIFRHRGAYYESRVSYFREPDRLDITIEHPRAEPASLEDALGRLMSEEAARGLFRLPHDGRGGLGGAAAGARRAGRELRGLPRAGREAPRGREGEGLEEPANLQPCGARRA